MGELPLFLLLYSFMGVATFFVTLQFYHIYSMYGKSKVYFIGLFYYFLVLQSFELAIQDSHPSHYITKTLCHLYISDPFWQSAENVD